MSEDEIEICKSLGKVKYLPGSFDKRFGNNISNLACNYPEKELTEKQIQYMYMLVYKYRRQIPIIYNKHKNNKYCQKIKAK